MNRSSPRDIQEKVNTSFIARRNPGGLVAAVAATVLLTGACNLGPSKSTADKSSAPATSGEALTSKSADEILNAATAAFSGATSVHMKGTFAESGQTMGLNLFVGAAGARGKIRAPIEKGKPVTLSILDTKREFYLKSPQMWRSVGDAEMAKTLGNRWVMIPKQNSADFKDFERLTDLQQFANEVFKSGGSVTKGKTTVIDGTPAIGLNGSDGTLYIATTGKPYPLKIVPKTPAKPGEQLAFLDYNAPLNVTPPANPVDLAKFGQ